MQEQAHICDAEHCIAENQLWDFLRASQADTLQKLADDYGTDARDKCSGHYGTDGSIAKDLP